jgi:hypothetical protein
VNKKALTREQIDNLISRLMEFEKWPKRKRIDYIAEKIMGWRKGVFQEGMEGFPIRLPPNQPCWIDKDGRPIYYAGEENSETDLGWNPIDGWGHAINEILRELAKESKSDRKRWERFIEIIEMLLLYVFKEEINTENIVLFMASPQNIRRALALLPEE